MKIAICGSIAFTKQIDIVRIELMKLGHDVEIPLSSKDILEGKISQKEFDSEEDRANRKIEKDVIRLYFNKIKEMDAILVLNMEKNEIKGYIGGNTFLEMGFAHVLEKKIFLWDEIPEMNYFDEIKAMSPTVINANLQLIE